MQESVIFSRRGGLAIATLNAPKSLNALSLDMIELLKPQLEHWARDDTVGAVWIEGAGDRALCAGGDVVALHKSAAAYGEEFDPAYGTEFFAREYHLDYAIHTYSKPIVVWGSGIVMGGGLGIMAGASHRLVTETTRMAMPEITIGLFPDVGGSWFLNRMPGRTGLFLGLTGASFNGVDAIFAGLADRIVGSDSREAILAVLGSHEFSGDTATDHAAVHELLKAEELDAEAQPSANLQAHFAQIQAMTDFPSLAAIVQSITGYSGEDRWLQKAAAGLASGCPVTPAVIWAQLQRSRHLSLKEVFQLELVMAVNCLRLGHFKEGVRALLIDKDRNPGWRPAEFDAVTADMVEEHFVLPWPQNPLQDL
ncbi:enoyl-CoA hydratase/isomerase family protein [Biformimicrobium ophioploci]|uniref:3-hydroxyisobutyryl-CoA hydrolase n=1 Tax=Biformimicrobium ophioploci TaxID=3036711 RepID=A0ABQ6M108_9GAMM|nr:enoyl-CoA hydratase/isomerase family protein [Microbulbifer sp. NKW57]GMG88031.1 enoyl-CoA hydratase/isomerase family protein [Microbulbifer sp. NKW57]